MTSSAARIGVDEFASSDTMLRLLLMMSSSIVGAEQRIGEPLSALAVLTGRHRAKNTRDPVCLARSTCLYLQPTGDRMVTPLPTESQRYREYGLFAQMYNNGFSDFQRNFQRLFDDVWAFSHRALG